MSSTPIPYSEWRNWSQDEEDLLISFIESGVDFDDAAKRLPGRTGDSCRGHYYPRLHWRKLLMDDEDDGDDPSNKSADEQEEELSLKPNEDIGDELMRDLEGDLEGAFILDLEREIEDSLTKISEEIDPRPEVPVSGIRSGDQRKAYRLTHWTPESEALLIKLKATGIKFDDIAKQIPEHSSKACANHYQRLVGKEKVGFDHWTPENEALLIKLRATGMKFDDISKQIPEHSHKACSRHYQKLVNKKEAGIETGQAPGMTWSPAEHAVIEHGRGEDMSYDKIAELLPGRSSAGCRNYWSRNSKAQSTKSRQDGIAQEGSRAMIAGHSKAPWSSEEDAVLIGSRESGMAWVLVAKELPGRGIAGCVARYYRIRESS